MVWGLVNEVLSVEELSEPVERISWHVSIQGSKRFDKTVSCRLEMYQSTKCEMVSHALTPGSWDIARGILGISILLVFVPES